MKKAIRAIGLIAAAAAWPLLIAGADAADKVRFQTDWLPSGEHAMYYGGWQNWMRRSAGLPIFA